MSNNNPKIIEIGGRQLHYVDQGEEGQSPVIIFIHGGLDDYRCWQFQVDSFSSKKYRAISYSRRFAYPNKWIGNVAQDNTIEENAKDLAELIRKLDVAPAHLVGASYGAYTALYCASKNPELAKTMVLNEPPIFEFLAKSPIKEDVELLQRFITRVQRPSEDVKQITTIPTLLVKGELSPNLFLRIVDILTGTMPNNTEQIVIPNVSHDDFKSGNFFTSKVMQFFERHN